MPKWHFLFQIGVNTILLPPWAQTWLSEISQLLQVLLIIVLALLLRWVLRRMVKRLGVRYALPIDITVNVRRLASGLIFFAAILAVSAVFGVDGKVLWAALTGFATVAAVAFFAAWSVLSNIFCGVLIWVVRPFRLSDHIELLEGGDKPGLKGQVVNMNLIYITLKEQHITGDESMLKIPNSLFFQRSTRRWAGPAPKPARTLEPE